MRVNRLTKFDPAENNTPQEKSKYINIFILFVIISFITAFIIGGITIGRNQYNEGQTTTEIVER